MSEASESSQASEPAAAGGRDYQAEADALVADLTASLPPAEATLALGVLLGRAATRLHNVARAEASARKGSPEWPAWAGLQNATRNLVLQSSTCRDLAARLVGRRR